MFGLLLAVIYLAFISLGLPDAVLGSAWPIMSQSFGTSVSSMGVVTMIIAAGTIFSSLQCDRLIQKIGVYRITVCSVGCTAISLFGFGSSASFWVLCLWAVPYGLGAGCVDAALNNYVALHFESKYMSWLHCMWGLGATLGPYIMALVLTNGFSYGVGYFVLCAIQCVLTAVLFVSKPVWCKKQTGSAQTTVQSPAKVLRLRQIFAIAGVPQVALTFFAFARLSKQLGFGQVVTLSMRAGCNQSLQLGLPHCFTLVLR